MRIGESSNPGRVVPMLCDGKCHRIFHRTSATDGKAGYGRVASEWWEEQFAWGQGWGCWEASAPLSLTVTGVMAGTWPWPAGSTELARHRGVLPAVGFAALDTTPQTA